MILIDIHTYTGNLFSPLSYLYKIPVTLLSMDRSASMIIKISLTSGFYTGNMVTLLRRIVYKYIN